MPRPKKKRVAEQLLNAAAGSCCREQLDRAVCVREPIRTDSDSVLAPKRVRSKEEQAAVDKSRAAVALAKVARKSVRTAEKRIRMHRHLHDAKIVRIEAAEKRCSDAQCWRIVQRLDQAEIDLYKAQIERLTCLLFASKIEIEERDARIALQKIQLARLRRKAPAAARA